MKLCMVQRRNKHLRFIQVQMVICYQSLCLLNCSQSFSDCWVIVEWFSVILKWFLVILKWFSSDPQTILVIVVILEHCSWFLSSVILKWFPGFLRDSQLKIDLVHLIKHWPKYMWFILIYTTYNDLFCGIKCKWIRIFSQIAQSIYLCSSVVFINM